MHSALRPIPTVPLPLRVPVSVSMPVSVPTPMPAVALTVDAGAHADAHADLRAATDRRREDAAVEDGTSDDRCLAAPNRRTATVLAQPKAQGFIAGASKRQKTLQMSGTAQQLDSQPHHTETENVNMSN